MGIEYVRIAAGQGKVRPEIGQADIGVKPTSVIIMQN